MRALKDNVSFKAIISIENGLSIDSYIVPPEIKF